MAVSPDGAPTADNGQSQLQSQSQGDQASTQGLQKKPKAAPKKNSTSSIKLSDWVTSTTKIKDRWDQIIIDHDRKFVQVRRISDDRVQCRYDDLKAAPPVDYIQDVLFYKVTRMCVVVFFSIVPFLCLNFRPCCFEYDFCAATRWVLLGGQHVYTAAQKHNTEFEVKNMETPDWTLVFGGYEVKQVAPCGLGAGLQAYIKSRPLLAQHPPHRSECFYSWIGLRMRMPMSTPFTITVLLCLKSVVLLPRKALWCVSFINSVLSMDLAEISASFCVPHVLLCSCCCQTVGWRWAFGEICGS